MEEEAQDLVCNIAPVVLRINIESIMLHEDASVSLYSNVRRMASIEYITLLS